MSAVDERVVEMRFDNKQFEKNIKESIKSLDDLDKQLGLLEDNDSFEGIDKSSRKLDFSRLVDGVGTLGEKFKWLETIATGALLRVGSKITDVVSKYAGMLSFQQISAGWNKFAEYSNATQSTLAATYDTWEAQADKAARLEYLYNQFGENNYAKKVYDTFEAVNNGTMTLYKATKALDMTRNEVQGLFDDISLIESTLTHEQFVEDAVKELNYYSDETSYNFTDMISTMSKVVAAGQELMDGAPIIEGMMNMVAMAGGNAQIGMRAAMQFTQAISKGKLASDDLRPLQSMNIITVQAKQAMLDEAEALGILTKSYDSAGKALYKYKGYKYTFNAEQGWEASVSSGWATGEVLNNTFKKYGEFSHEMYNLMQENVDYQVSTTEALGHIDEYYAALAEGVDSKAMDSFDKKMAKIFGDNTEAIDKYKEGLNKLGSDQMKFSRLAFESGQQARTFKDAIEAVADAASTQWMNIFKLFLGSSERAKEVWTELNNTLYEIFVTPLNSILHLLSRVQKGFVLFSDGEVIDAFEAFRRSLSNIQEALLSIIDPIREAFGDVFLSNAAENIAKLIKKFWDFSKSLILSEEGTEKLYNISSTLFSALKGISKVIGGIFKVIKPIFKLVGPIARLIGTIVSSVFNLIGALLGINEASEENGFIAFCENAAEAVGNAVDFISGAIDVLTEWIASHINLEEAKKHFESFKKTLVGVWDKIKKSATDSWEKVKEFIHIEDITKALDDFWQKVQGFLPSWEEVVDALSAGWEMFKQVGLAIWEFIRPYIEKLGKALGTLWDKISGFIDGFAKSDDKLGYIKDNFLGIVDAFLEWKKNSKFINFLKESFDKLKETIEKVKEALSPKEGEGGTTAGRFMGIMYLVASLVALFLILRNVDRIVGGFTNITKAIKKFSGFLNKAALFVGLYLIVKAITGLIDVLTEFAQLESGQIGNAIGAVLVLMVGLALFATHMKKITEGLSEKKLKNLKTTCLVMAAVMLAIAGAMWVLMQSPGSNASLLQRVIMMLIPLAAMLGMVYVLSKIPNGIDLKSLGALIVIAGVLFVAALAIDKLAKIPEDAMAQAQKLLLALAGAVIVAMIIGNFMKNGAGAIKNIGIAVAAMAAALLMIVIALSKLQGMTFDWNMVSMILTIVAILGVLAAIPVAMTRFLNHDQMSPKNMLKMATVVGVMTACLVVVALSMGLLVKGMKKAGANPGDILAIGITLGVIMICLGVMASFMAKATQSANGEKGNSMKQTAKAIRSMVVSMLLIVAAIVVLTKLNVNADDMMDALMIIVGAGLVIVGMVAGMAWASSLAQHNKISSGPIITAVISIIAIIGTMMILSKFLQKGNDLRGAFDVVLEVSLVLALLVAIMAGAQKLAGGNLQWAPILVLIGGIVAIMHMMMIMTGFAGDALTQVTKVLLVLAGALAALMLAAAVLQKSSTSTGNTIRSIVMLIAIVGAIVALAYTLKQLQGVEVPWQTIWQIIAVLGILTLLVGGLGIAAGASGVGAAGIIVMSIAIIAVAGAIWILANAADVAAGALPKLATGMQMIFDTIANISFTNDQMKQFMTVLITLAIAGTVAMIGMGVGALIMAAGFYVGALALSLVSGILPELSTGLTVLITTLGMLAPVIDPAVKVAWKLVLVFMALMLGGIMLGIGLGVAGAGLFIVSSAAMVLAIAIAIAAVALSGLTLSLALLAEGVALVVDLFKGGNLSEQVAGFSDSVRSSTGEITDSLAEMKAQVADQSGGEFNLMSLLGGGEGGFDVSALKDTIMGEGGLGGLFSGGDMQNMLSGGFTDMMSGAMGDLDMTSIMGSFGGNLEGVDMESIMAEYGIGDQFAGAMFSGVTEEGMEEPANELAGEFADTLSSTSNTQQVKSAGGTLGISGSSGASATKSSWFSAGTYCAQGLIDGVASKIKASDLIGTKLANALIQACKEQLQVKSPSRVFYQMGEYAAEGLALGVQDKSDFAVDSVTSMAKQTIAAATEALAAAIENDYASPVIAPVLDLSNVADGASRINSMFGNNRIGVDGEIQNGEAQTSGVTYNYTQNNYSPKPLSRIEIYRQTRNQLSTLKV